MEYTTAKDLKEILKDVDDETIIVLSTDSEGNSFSPLSKDYGEDNYLPEKNRNYGEVYPSKLTEDLIKEGWTEEDLGTEEEQKKMIKCITLYPLH